MSEPLLLSARQLHRSYLSEHRDVHVLRGADLEVAEGEVLAVLAAAGASIQVLVEIARHVRGELFVQFLAQKRLGFAATHIRLPSL